MGGDGCESAEECEGDDWFQDELGFGFTAGTQRRMVNGGVNLSSECVTLR